MSCFVIYYEYQSSSSTSFCWPICQGGHYSKNRRNSPFSPCLPCVHCTGEKLHFESDNSDHDSNQVYMYLCCAKYKIRVFQLLRDDGSCSWSLQNVSWSESKCTRSCKCCWKCESKRKMAAKSFLNRDCWRILCWHDVYLLNIASKIVQPSDVPIIRNNRLINRRSCWLWWPILIFINRSSDACTKHAITRFICTRRPQANEDSDTDNLLDDWQ